MTRILSEEEVATWEGIGCDPLAASHEALRARVAQLEEALREALPAFADIYGKNAAWQPPRIDELNAAERAIKAIRAALAAAPSGKEPSDG